MELILGTTPAERLQVDALAVIACTKEPEGGLPDALLERLDDATRGLLRDLYASGEFTGKSMETVLLHRPAGPQAARLLLIGGGDPKSFSPHEARKAAGVAVRTLKPKSVRSIAMVLEHEWATPELVEAICEGAVLGDFETDRHKTDPKKDEKRIDAFRVSVPEESIPFVEAMRRGRVLGEAQNFTRMLANEPPNLLTPLKLAAVAEQMAAEFGLECEVLDKARMHQLGMNLLLGVAQGSVEPPALVILRYKPSAPAPGGAHLALVGKGVTFDTGGVNLKPTEGMEKMKYDMSGAATVLGAMRALAQLKPDIPVTAYAPCVENMIGGRAQRPSDIVKSLQGKTVEILNTDAEGRLILADALTYAVRQGATHLVDAATLTGAVAVALGFVHAGVFTNNESLQTALLNAARAEGEKMWPLPMDEEYMDLLKSNFADLPNIGGRYGGAISAAKFLEQFVEGKPWVHLDIAGTAWLEEGKPFLAKGPSGIGVRTMVRLASDWQ